MYFNKMQNNQTNSSSNSNYNFPKSGNPITIKDQNLLKLLVKEIINSKHRDELDYK